MNRYIHNIGTVALSVTLLGCAVTTPESGVVLRSVAAAEVALTSLERAALQYTSLPSCQLVPAPCADPDVKARIKAADQVAYDAVSRARNNTGTLAAAAAAINALRAAVPTN